MAASWRIRGVRLIDPYQQIDQEGVDIGVAAGKFVSAKDLPANAQEFDGRGLWLVPRMVDMHVHFREPGMEWKENIVSGSNAAAAGGFSAVSPMANTQPVVDTPSLIEWQVRRGEQDNMVRLWPIGAVTKNLAGQELADLYLMKTAGAVGFSDDGRCVQDARLMRAALSDSVLLKRPVIQHAEDHQWSQGTVMHEGAVSHQLGLAGVPAEAESVIVWRDVQIAGLTQGYLHVAHISAIGSLDALAYAQERGWHVSAEAAPHHLFFSDEAVREWQYNP
ncbi:MAG: amidohydrolase family protein, partial [Firmicutes bacterium]|nr:amidohydrolase family protein [Bacillota bacterium]